MFCISLVNKQPEFEDLNEVPIQLKGQNRKQKQKQKNFLFQLPLNFASFSLQEQKQKATLEFQLKVIPEN